jgi:cyclopropane fatty-acyl-phospholipid synthase-like methyltransferase
LSAGFDHIAPDYDAGFTSSQIGKLQRQIVWRYLDASLDRGKPLNILELGCGTGTDAIRFARAGHHVLATDASSAMIEVARQKARGQNFEGSIEFELVDMRYLQNNDFNLSIDLIFSNFGAVNCLSPEDLAKLFSDCCDLLSPKGRMILVIMPDKCIWESSYFGMRFQWKKAFRRGKEKEVVLLGENEVETWYYSHRRIKELSNKWFDATTVIPVGLFIPPSYMEPFFVRRKTLLHGLSWLDRRMAKGACAASISDHYIINLRKIK